MRKGVVSYVGTVGELKRLAAFKRLGRQKKTRYRHINRHQLMRRDYPWGGGDAA
jgi:hypothetical protein